MDINASVDLVKNKVAEWIETIIQMLPNFVVAVVVLVLFYFIAKLVRKLVSKVAYKVSSSDAVNNLISNITYIFVIALGLFVALGVLQLDKTVTSLLAGVGIIGLALGFAFQDTAANFVSGVIIAFRKPYNVGDVIQSGDFFGKVYRINLRTTDIQLFQGPIVLIPNKDVFQNPVTNFTVYGKRRIDLAVGVSYGDDLEKVKKVTIDAVKEVENLDPSENVTLFYDEFGSSSINFNVRFWVKYSNKHSDYLQVKSDAIMKIKSAYDANDIMIPFPIRTLDFGIKGGEKLSEMKVNVNSPD